MLPSIQPSLSAVAALHFLLLSLSLVCALSLSVFAPHLGESGTMHGRAPFVEFKAGLRASRRFIKKARQQLPTCEEGKRTNHTAGGDTDFISTIFECRNYIYSIINLFILFQVDRVFKQ